MPIRVIRDDGSQRERPERPDLPPIVIDRSANAPAKVDTKKADTQHKSGPTSWALVSCECTMTETSYQLAFRRQGDVFVLESSDRASGHSVKSDISAIEGPFNWQGFVCPECRLSWSDSFNAKSPSPIIKCGCGRLFCTRKGFRKVASTKGSEEDTWHWKCPKCGVDKQVSRTLNLLKGQALKGK